MLLPRLSVSASEPLQPAGLLHQSSYSSDDLSSTVSSQTNSPRRQTRTYPTRDQTAGLPKKLDPPRTLEARVEVNAAPSARPEMEVELQLPRS